MLRFRSLLGFLASLVAGNVAHAIEVEILRVDFDLVDQSGARNSWYELAVTISVEQGSSEDDANPRFADDVAVSVAFAAEKQGSGPDGIVYFANRVEYPTLERGQHVVRFYLPPEVVKRDRIKGEPYAYEIEVLSEEGLEASLTSRNLSDERAQRSFHSRVSSSRNVKGVLLAQYQTPFAWAYPRDTPNPRRDSGAE